MSLSIYNFQNSIMTKKFRPLNFGFMPGFILQQYLPLPCWSRVRYPARSNLTFRTFPKASVFTKLSYSVILESLYFFIFTRSIWHILADEFA
jgi:hypothetical protein